MYSISTEEKLQERIKELTCLYSISNVFLKDLAVEETLTQVAEIVKLAWRYPEAVFVEIQLDDYYVLLNPLPKATIFQENSITIFEQKRGFIKIYYESKTFNFKQFLEDEKKLLNNISIKLGSYYEKYLNKQELQNYKSKTEQLDRLSILGEITAGIAHELNTPLGNILGFAELILNRTQDNQVMQDISKVIKASIYSREIVKKLMFFSCELPQEMRFISINPVIVEVLSLLEPNFTKTKLSSKYSISDETVVVQFDTIQLMQVLFNILVNSIYVAPKGSEISINVSNDKESIFIEISDFGPGIAEDLKQKIFEPFFTTKPVGEGTGLGLSVVHGIIKSHKGEIKIENNQPTGSTFRIRLPLTQ